LCFQKIDHRYILQNSGYCKITPSDQQKTFLKKLSGWLLRLAGGLLFLLFLASEFLCASQMIL